VTTFDPRRPNGTGFILGERIDAHPLAAISRASTTSVTTDVRGANADRRSCSSSTSFSVIAGFPIIRLVGSTHPLRQIARLFI
jgi:hypothetical protein